MGEGEFYRTDYGNIQSVSDYGKLQLLKQHTGWRNSWSIIIPGHFGKNVPTALFFYDRAAGEGEFYSTDDHYNIQLLKQYTGFRKSWDIIVLGNFGRSGYFRDLLFYDRAAGEGEFYTTDGYGNLQLLKKYTGWRKSWSIIVPTEQHGNSTDLLFYDRAAGEGEFYSTDGYGNIQLLKQHTGWRNSWSMIVPGRFSSGKYRDLLFYDRAAGEGEFYTTDGYGNIQLLKQHTGWRNSWSMIVKVEFADSSGGNTALLFYDRAAGEGEFYTTDGHGNIQLLKKYTGFRKSWSIILPVEYGNGGATGLLFYDAIH
jgi:hypothetical protein